MQLLSTLFFVLLACCRCCCVGGMSLVSGNVFCDQCLHGRPSMWGTPIQGAMVMVHCRDRRGVALQSRAYTNFLGAFVTKFPGASLQGCTSHLVWSPIHECSSVTGSGRRLETLRLEWKMFQDTYYTLKPLYFKPQSPMSHCPVSKPKVSVSPTVFPKVAPSVSSNHSSSFCRADHWMNPAYLCNWRLLAPHQVVGAVLGRGAEGRYGNMTLLQALQTGPPLLSESLAALLNSYFNVKFPYSPLWIATSFKRSLSHHEAAVRLAAQLRRANAGLGMGHCLLQVCT